MEMELFLHKMISEKSDPILYFLKITNDIICVNDWIGKKIKIKNLHNFLCDCGQESEQPFRQGLCKKCFFESPLNGASVFRPELSKAHLDIEERDLEWEKKYQLQPHLLYLSNTDKIKIGVTRKNQNPTRWIDQGAIQAHIIMESPNRYLVGIAEAHLKNFFADRTTPKKMICNHENIDFKDSISLAIENLPQEAKENSTVFDAKNEDTYFEFQYPLDYKKLPAKINSINLQKEDEFTSTLIGIKGQYLVFENGAIWNIRNFEKCKAKINIL